MDKRPAAAAFWIGFLANLALAGFAWTVLPARVASHFDLAGNPNAWAPKGVFVAIQAGVVLLLGLAIALNGRLLRMSGARLNLPHKEHWLAPERREETLAWLDAYMAWFGAATFALLLDVFTQVLRMNLGRAGRLEHAGASVAAFAAFGVVWAAVLLRRFSRPT
ncbi:MAG: DUF1648 domain-containing protein [Elusimicrobia bacterium]|nr:DUF1648 domain-containing protein [Elusimicrobiota bacterium]